jgi:hypothetical protein
MRGLRTRLSQRLDRGVRSAGADYVIYQVLRRKDLVPSSMTGIGSLTSGICSSDRTTSDASVRSVIMTLFLKNSDGQTSVHADKIFRKFIERCELLHTRKKINGFDRHGMI